MSVDGCQLLTLDLEFESFLADQQMKQRVVGRGNRPPVVRLCGSGRILVNQFTRLSQQFVVVRPS